MWVISFWLLAADPQLVENTLKVLCLWLALSAPLTLGSGSRAVRCWAHV